MNDRDKAIIQKLLLFLTIPHYTSKNGESHKAETLIPTSFYKNYNLTEEEVKPVLMKMFDLLATMK